MLAAFNHLLQHSLLCFEGRGYELIAYLEFSYLKPSTTHGGSSSYDIRLFNLLEPGRSAGPAALLNVRTRRKRTSKAVDGHLQDNGEDEDLQAEQQPPAHNAHDQSAAVEADANRFCLSHFLVGGLFRKLMSAAMIKAGFPRVFAPALATAAATEGVKLNMEESRAYVKALGQVLTIVLAQQMESDDGHLMWSREMFHDQIKCVSTRLDNYGGKRTEVDARIIASALAGGDHIQMSAYNKSAFLLDLGMYYFFYKRFVLCLFLKW
jgi:hypothetical protein